MASDRLTDLTTVLAEEEKFRLEKKKDQLIETGFLFFLLLLLLSLLSREEGRRRGIKMGTVWRSERERGRGHVSLRQWGSWVLKIVLLLLHRRRCRQPEMDALMRVQGRKKSFDRRLPQEKGEN